MRPENSVQDPLKKQKTLVHIQKKKKGKRQNVDARSVLAVPKRN